MKVLHLNDYYERLGGAESILFNMLEALEEQGVSNVVVHEHPVASRSTTRPAHEVPNLGDADPRRASTAADRFREILRREQPDLIHIHDVGNPNIAEISRLCRPTIQSVYNHSFYCPGGDKYLPFLGRICERPFGAACLAAAFLTHCNSIRPRVLLSSYRRCHRMMKNNEGLVFLTLSKYQAERLLQSGCPPNAVKVLPPFTDLPKIHAAPWKKQILFAGRLVKQKGLDRLIRALPYIDPSCHLIVSGDGPEVHIAMAVAQHLGVGPRVDWLGWMDKDRLARYYDAAAVVVVPSIWPEPFGLVGIEAMSYGKPVVAFNVGGIPEWLEDGVTGLLVKPYDVRKMAAKIDFLLQNPALAREMGQRGRKKVEAEFSKEKHTTTLLKIYSEVLGVGER